MGWGEEKAKRGQGKWASSQATDQALDLLPPLFQLACRLHASSLSFCSELVRRALIHAHENSEAEGREEPARASVFRSRLSEGVREGSGNGYIARHVQQPHGFSFDAWRLTSPTGRIKQYHGDIKTLFYTNFLWEAELYLAFRRLKVALTFKHETSLLLRFYLLRGLLLAGTNWRKSIGKTSLK